MIARRTVLIWMGGATLAAGAFATGAYPDRCSHLVLIVPAANLTGRDPVAFTPLQRLAVERILNSDVWFWTFAVLFPNALLRTLLATDSALLAKVSPEERRRADLIREGLMPISRKTDGLRTDGFWAGTPASTAFERIALPTLILACEDDLFGTAATARLLAARIPGARLKIYPDGGHIWLGHDAELTQDITDFIAGSARR